MTDKRFLVNRLGQLAQKLFISAEQVGQLAPSASIHSPDLGRQTRVFSEWMRHLAVETYDEMARVEAKDCNPKLD